MRHIFRTVARTAIEMVTDIHDRGVVMGDTSQMWIIDFESAALPGDDRADAERAAMWGTPGFIFPTRASRGRLSAETTFTPWR